MVDVSVGVHHSLWIAGGSCISAYVMIRLNTRMHFYVHTPKRIQLTGGIYDEGRVTNRGYTAIGSHRIMRSRFTGSLVSFQLALVSTVRKVRHYIVQHPISIHASRLPCSLSQLPPFLP